MSEQYNREGSPQSIRDKYHSKAAETYREHLAACERGEASGDTPVVPFEIAVVQVKDLSKLGASGFGSAPPPEEASSFGLISGLGSLTSKAAAAARQRAAGAAEALKNSERLGSLTDTVKGSVKGAVQVARSTAESYASFDASADLSHLRVRGVSDGPGGNGEGAGSSSNVPEDDGWEGFGGFDSDGRLASTASSVASTASWLLGAAKESVQRVSTFDPG